MKLLLLCLTCAAWLSAALFASAQEKVGLTVRVVDAVTGQPIAGFRAQTYDSAAVAGVPHGPPDGDSPGNTDGVAFAQFAPADTNGFRRRLVIRHPDYVPMEKWWMQYARPGTPSVEFPKELTVKLERGVAVGGTVKDATGRPLAGVRVYPLRTAMRPDATAPLLPSSYTLDGVTNAPFATTDAAGRWLFSRFPSDFAEVAFSFVRPDQSFLTVQTSEDRYQLRFGPVIPLGEFLDQRAEVTLPEGQAVRGVVVGADGKPLAGVKLSETHGRVPGIVGRTVTGADGRFVLPHRPPKELVLVASLPGYALLATNVIVEPGLPELRLTLRTQQGIAGRVVDGEGRPIVSARVAPNQYGFFNPFEWVGTNTDAAGRFRWEAGPFEPTELHVVITNGPVRKLTMRAGEPERVIVIRPEQKDFIRLTGTVTGAETRQPVDKFTIQSAGTDTTSFSFKAEGRNGRMDTQLPLTAWRPQMLPVGELQILAEGFAPHPLGRVEFREGDREFHVELQRGVSVLAGVVLQPDGQPAKGAQMELTRGISMTYLNRPGEFQPPGREAERSTTAADGKFSFAHDTRNKMLVVSHASGFAAEWTTNLVAGAALRLQPWARVTGIALESGHPLTNHSITLRTPSVSFGVRGFGVNYTVKTDADGRFAFERVPAGGLLLCRRAATPASRNARANYAIEYTHGQPVSVSAGETLEVTYGGRGRLVTGLAQSDPPELAVDWQWDRVFLTPATSQAQVARPNFHDFATQQSYLAALRRAFPDGGQMASEVRYQVQFDSDGRFQAAGIPPGKYQLIINLTEPTPDQRPFYEAGKPIGAGSLTVVIPDGPLEEPFDVGTVHVKISANLPKAAARTPFEAQTLDGRPLRLADFAGKHVVLVFWAGWCRASAEAMPELQRLHAAFRDHPRFAMIGVSLDESAAAARMHADKLGRGWATGWLDEPGRLRLLDTHGVKGTPTIFVLDPSGRITARDPQPATLRAALEKLLGPK